MKTTLILLLSLLIGISLTNVINNENLNLKSFLTEEENLSFSLSCTACKLGAEAGSKLLSSGKSAIAVIAKLGCYIALKDETLCKGVINLMKDPVVDNLASKLGDTDYVCGLIGGYCDTDLKYEDFDSWANQKLASKPAKVQRNPTGKGTYKIMTFSDLHLDLEYEQGYKVNCGVAGGDCCNKGAGPPSSDPNDRSKYWSTPFSGCDIPPYLVDAAVDFVLHSDIKPDMVMLLGDYTDHRIWSANPDRQESFRTYVAKAFKPLIDSGVPHYAILGNHELLPVDVYDVNGDHDSYILQQSADTFKDMIPADAQEEFRKSGCYSHMIRKNMKVVALFPGAADPGNYYLMHDSYDPMNQIQWLEEQLASAEAAGQQVLLINHIPFRSNNYAYEKHFMVLSERYENIIRGFVTAHTHHDHLMFVRRKETDPINFMMFTSPALTTNGNIRPSFRVYEFDEETDVLIDYYQYSLDVSDPAKIDDKTWKPQWEQTYQFTTEYDVTSIHDLASLEAMYQKFKSGDIAFVQKFIDNYNTHHSETVDANRAYAEYCDLIIDQKDHDKCRNPNSQEDKEGFKLSTSPGSLVDEINNLILPNFEKWVEKH